MLYAEIVFFLFLFFFYKYSPIASHSKKVCSMDVKWEMKIMIIRKITIKPEFEKVEPVKVRGSIHTGVCSIK